MRRIKYTDTEAFRADTETIRRLMTGDIYITQQAMTDLTGISGANIRQIVGHMRDNGVPVASTSDGYKITNDVEELAKTAAHLRSRATMMVERADDIDQMIQGINLITKLSGGKSCGN